MPPTPFEDSLVSLTSPSWADRLAALALAITDSLPGEEARRIGELRELLLQAPSAGAIVGARVPDPAAFEAMLKARAFESAALLLFGTDCGYMLSRGSRGEHMASVLLPGRPEESTASADSAALALVAAMAMALQDAPLLFGKYGDAASAPAFRLN